MAKFITGEELEKVVYDIIWEAEQTLMIVSPYVKLDNYFKTLFDKHTRNHKLHIILVFGKNEGDVSRSMSKSDFDYFKKFLNISIVYVSNLHAKYYGNEKKGVVTSINLYDYSFKNNIEFGVYSEITAFSNLTNTIAGSSDQDAWNTCWKLAENNELVFAIRPVYEKKLLSIITGKNYVKSETVYDVTDKFYGNSFNRSRNNEVKKINDFPSEIEMGSNSGTRPTRQEMEKEIIKEEPKNKKPYNNNTGYCIRTGERIPYNPNKPMSENAYRVWAQFGNPDFQENFCHATGRNSNGRTTMRNPILNQIPF